MLGRMRQLSGAVGELRSAVRQTVEAFQVQPARMPKPHFRDSASQELASLRNAVAATRSVRTAGAGQSRIQMVGTKLIAADDAFTAITAAVSKRPSLRRAHANHSLAKKTRKKINDSHITGAVDAGERLGNALFGLFSKKP